MSPRWPFSADVGGLWNQCCLVGVGLGGIVPRDWQREFRFHPVRKWQFDIALPTLKIAIEYQGLFLKGGAKGGHQTIKGLRRDWEKIREAQLAGWIILPFGPDETRSGEAMNVIERAIQSRLEGKAA